VTSCGNSVLDKTFNHCSNKIRKLCTTATDDNVELVQKDWQKARSAFLYFAGTGWVHKGLDLVVEAFLQEPGLTLHIAASEVGKDSEFYQIYGREIEAAGNIIVHGFINPHSPQFYGLTRSCVAVIIPSCFDQCSGGAVHCMHHGLLPILTPTAGVDIHHILPSLEGETDAELIDAIRKMCHEVSQMSEVELEDLSYAFWKYARTHHTHSSYSQALSRVLDELIG
jgi:glycosyltransferase involved in cell wall biosynthesis